MASLKQIIDMKKIVVGIFLFLIYQQGIAQYTASTKDFPQTKFGLKVGYSQFSIYGDDLQKITSNGAASATKNPFLGLSVTNRLNHFLILKHEISFVGKGAKIHLIQEETGQLYNSTLDLSYIEFMPISPALYFKGFQLYAGPYIGVLLHSSVTKQDKNGNTYKDKSIYGDAEQEADYIQKTDFGYIVGIEYALPLGINIGVKMSRGLNALFEDAENNGSQWNIKNKGVLIHLGYDF